MDVSRQSSPGSERRVGRLVMTLAIAGFAALIAAAALVGWSVQRSAVHARWVEHTYQVEQKVAEFRVLIERMEVQRRGFLLTGGKRFGDKFRESAAAEPATLASLRRATADNPAQRANVAQAEQLAVRHVRRLAASIALAARNPGAAVATFESDGSVELTRALRRLSERMIAEEQRLLAIRTAAQRDGARVVYGSIVAAGVLLIAVALFSIVALRRYTAGLSASHAELAAFNETLEQRVAERTRELSRANDEIQRFAYIVSHDLRSPLVNVMGFTGELETSAQALAALVDTVERDVPALLSDDARLAAREDLPEAIGFIRTSTQKMDRLINAILKLSREGKRVLAPQPIDLAAMAEAIAATLRHRLDEIGAEVTVERPMPALTADRLAVEQMLSNLIENAVKYLDPARPGRIAVSARATGGRVAIAVADNGRGIDPRDHQRIFDLFRRSGTQDQPGEGIGLAHVRALAYRLGGLVDCRSSLGKGATFTLTLPDEPAKQGSDTA